MWIRGHDVWFDLNESLPTPPWINKKSESNQTSWPLIHTTLNKSLPTPPLSQVPRKLDTKLSRASPLTYELGASRLVLLRSFIKHGPKCRLRNKSQTAKFDLITSTLTPQNGPTKPCFDPTACSPPHSKIIYPNHIVSDIDLRHTTTTTYDAKLWFCLIQDKTPKAFWLYHMLIQQPHFYHLWHGIPYPTEMGPATVACG